MLYFDYSATTPMNLKLWLLIQKQPLGFMATVAAFIKLEMKPVQLLTLQEELSLTLQARAPMNAILPAPVQRLTFSP